MPAELALLQEMPPGAGAAQQQEVTARLALLEVRRFQRCCRSRWLCQQCCRRCWRSGGAREAGTAAKRADGAGSAAEGQEVPRAGLALRLETPVELLPEAPVVVVLALLLGVPANLETKNKHEFVIVNRCCRRSP